MGEFTREEFQESFEAQVQGLVEGEVDFLSIETMYSLDEAICAVRAAKKLSKLPVSGCMTFDRNPRGFFTLMGEALPRRREAREAEGADVIGSNCSHGSPVFLDLARIIRDATRLPVIIQPNRGRPTLEGGTVIYKQTAQEFIDDMKTIVGLGANVIGGCCGTEPEFIAGLRKEFRDRFPAEARSGARP